MGNSIEKFIANFVRSTGEEPSLDSQDELCIQHDLFFSTSTLYVAPQCGESLTHDQARPLRTLWSHSIVPLEEQSESNSTPIKPLFQFQYGLKDESYKICEVIAGVPLASPSAMRLNSFDFSIVKKEESNFSKGLSVYINPSGCIESLIRYQPIFMSRLLFPVFDPLTLLKKASKEKPESSSLFDAKFSFQSLSGVKEKKDESCGVDIRLNLANFIGIGKKQESPFKVPAIRIDPPCGFMRTLSSNSTKPLAVAKQTLVKKRAPGEKPGSIVLIDVDLPYQSQKGLGDKDRKNCGTIVDIIVANFFRKKEGLEPLDFKKIGKKRKDEIFEGILVRYGEQFDLGSSSPDAQAKIDQSLREGLPVKLAVSYEHNNGHYVAISRKLKAPNSIEYYTGREVGIDDSDDPNTIDKNKIASEEQLYYFDEQHILRSAFLDDDGNLQKYDVEKIKIKHSKAQRDFREKWTGVPAKEHRGKYDIIYPYRGVRVQLYKRINSPKLAARMGLLKRVYNKN